MVGEKRKASSESGSAKKRQAISFETKVAIIKKLDTGEKMVSVARAYNLNRLTVGTIYKQKDRIMEHVKGAVPMQSTIISKKRGKIIEEMEKILTIWLEDQQQRRIPLSLMLIQEKAKSIFEDVKAKAGESALKKRFLPATGGFTVSRRGLISTMCPCPERQHLRTKRLPSDSPKSEVVLPGKWNSIQDPACAGQCPWPPPYLDDFHPDVKAVYLPPNTTSLLQPMDQGFVANFKKYYTRRTHRMALKAVTEVNLNAVWRPLCPQFVNDFRGFDQDGINKEILSTLVSLSDKLELDLQEEDFEELLESYGEELSNQDLMELEAQQRVEEEEEEETPVPMKKFETKLLAEGFSLIDKAIALFEQQDPSIERCTKVANQLNDAIQCYRIIYDEKKKKTVQSSLDRFFRPVSSKSSKEDTLQPSSSSPRPSTSSYIEVTEEEVTFEAHSSDDEDPLMT
ncbi:tigger transposable element-derived protein 1-like [Palaemon carinicauda]|uniref:tigger transposable element-derived protein 1-like n=1 Tax=Palaemon carinicauda TaxID=392227 RepID=UPI0035B6514A